MHPSHRQDVSSSGHAMHRNNPTPHRTVPHAAGQQPFLQPPPLHPPPPPALRRHAPADHALVHDGTAWVTGGTHAGPLLSRTPNIGYGI